MHRYQTPTRTRERRPVTVQTNEPTIVTWIVAGGFLFILLVGFIVPILQHLTGAAR